MSATNKKTKAKRKSKKQTLWWRRKPFVVCMAAVLLSMVGCILWYNNVCRARYEGEEVRFFIPNGSTNAAIRDTLCSRLGDYYGQRVYRIWSWRNGNPSVAVGSYLVAPGSKALETSHKLLTGAESPVKVTFNNVRTMQQLADRISAKLDFSADDFLTACDKVLPEFGFTKATYPAAFFPDTYEFYWSADPEYVVKRLVDVRNKYWNAERRAIASNLGLNPVQVATVASIVEEETNKADERPKVARLYLNRLNKGMKLQADPTVKFALGDFSLRRITKKHLEVKSPYNTYQNAGLPPGPIRIVERKTLDDVLYAPTHNYLYMCAKEDFSGYHNFAVTDQQHMANARKYHAALNARGIR